MGSTIHRASAVLRPVYLLVAARAGGAAQNSMRQLVSGRISLVFYVGAIGVGIVVPLSLGIASQLADTGNVVLALVGVASLVGDFSVRYSVVKAGVYEPLRSAALPAIDVRSPLPQNVGQPTKGRLGAV